jgi:hypothetical protein
MAFDPKYTITQNILEKSDKNRSHSGWIFIIGARITWWQRPMVERGGEKSGWMLSMV